MIKKCSATLALLCASFAFGQSVRPILQPQQVYVDGNGVACAGCSLYSYVAGSTTPLPTYTDSTGTVQNSNPVIIGVNGIANVWVATTAYKFILKDTSGAVVWSVDNVESPGGGGGGGVPAPPAFAVQLANSGATAFQADSSITINPSTHTLTAPNFAGAISVPIVAGATAVATIGDSLTQGSFAGTSGTGGLPYPTTLQKLLGQTVYNLGYCGQISDQIAARLGAIHTTVTVAGNTIPTSGSVNVSFTTPDPSAGCFAPKTFTAVIGGVTGEIGNPTTSQAVFTPTVYPVSPVTVPPGSAWTPVLGNMLNGTVVIWAGENDIYTRTLSQTIAAVTAIINILPSPKRFVVLSITNGDIPDQYVGQSTYIDILARNAALQSLATANGGGYVDIRAILVAAYNPANAQDVIDHGHDVPPASLRGLGGNTSITADVTTTGQTAIQLSTCRNGTLMPGSPPGGPYYVGEFMEIVSCNTGTNVATVTRAYAGTTAATYTSPLALSYIDYRHYDLGYTNVANAVNTWIHANATQAMPLSTLYDMFGTQIYPSNLLQYGNQTSCPIIHDDVNLHVTWPVCFYSGSGTLNTPDGTGFGWYITNVALGSSDHFLAQQGVYTDGSRFAWRAIVNDVPSAWQIVPSNPVGFQYKINQSTTPTDMNLQTSWPWIGETGGGTANLPVPATHYLCYVSALGHTTGYVSQTCIDASNNYWVRAEFGAGTWSAWQQLAAASAAPVNNPVTSATGGTGITPTCTTANCTNLSGTYSLAGGGTATTGTALTLVWPTTTAVYKCWASQNGGAVNFGIGNNVATATGMVITNAVSMVSATAIVNYGCSQN